MIWLLGVALAAAQAPQTKPGPAAASADGKAAPPKIPPPEEVVLTARDNLELDATFYGSFKGREAVPVVLLHTFKGSRADFGELALSLQSLGHAVIVPDLRGHGTSKKRGATRQPDNPNPSREFFTLMVTNDMEAVKAFLMTKNNAGELNIEKLCVIGAEMGATIAMNWAYYDWSQPALLGGKQGQDVKALVLISPEFAFRGLSLKQAGSDEQIRKRLSILILVGKSKTKALQEAERVYGLFKFYHPDPSTLEKRAEEQDLFFGRLDTTLQGTQMLTAKGLNVGASIAQFIKLRLESKSFPWKERKTP